MNYHYRHNEWLRGFVAEQNLRIREAERNLGEALEGLEDAALLLGDSDNPDTLSGQLFFNMTQQVWRHGKAVRAEKRAQRDAERVLAERAVFSGSRA